MSTTASIGWQRINSSVSIAIKLRNIIAVGETIVSPSDIVPKTIGTPPASDTPRATARTMPGTSR